MASGLGPRAVLEERLLQVACVEPLESAVKVVLAEARLGEKFGCGAIVRQ